MRWIVAFLLVVAGAAPAWAAGTEADAYYQLTNGSWQAVSAANPLPVNATVTATATTTATASATPTTVSAGPNIPLNVDLHSAMFVQPTFAGTPVDGTHGLPINCISGCSGGAADESAFVAGTTSIFTGGFFQTTATSNALTNGQAGVVQMTAQRAFFVNIRNSSGTEVVYGAGATGAASERVTVAQDSTTVAGSASIPAGTNLMGKVGIDQTTSGTTNGLAVVGVNAATALAGAGAVGTGSLRIAVGQDSTTVAGSSSLPAGTNIVGKAGIDQTTPGTTNGTAIVGVNAATALAGAGATGTGSLRVTAAQDTTTVAGSAPGTAGTPSANVVTTQTPTSNLVVGNATITTATNTSLITAQGGSTKIYMTEFSCYNSGSTATTLTFTSGSGGTTMWQTGCPAGGGSNLALPSAVATGANAALFVTTGSASTSVLVSVGGYTGP